MKKIYLLFILLAISNLLVAQTPKSVIKNYFVTGAIPTQSQFATFIDNSYNEVTSNILQGTGFPTILYQPWTSKGTGRLYTGVINPDGTVRLNYDGYFYATVLYSNGYRVSESRGTTLSRFNFTSPQNQDFILYNSLTGNFENYTVAQVKTLLGATWNIDSVRYASKSGVIADTTKLHNQIITKLAITDTTKLHNQIATKQNQLSGTGFVKASGTTITYDNSTYQPAGSYMLNSDTARYISKSQARKDIHDSIVPLRADVSYLMNLNYTDSYTIPPNDTIRIKVGNIFEDDGIFIQRYIIKDSLGHKVMGENLNILTDINSLTIDYGKYITNYTLDYNYSFVIDTDLQTIYWVFINKNSFSLTLKYYKNPLKF